MASIRTELNRRQYSDKEIERLVLLKRSTNADYKISQTAYLSTENLVKFLAKDHYCHAVWATSLIGCRYRGRLDFKREMENHLLRDQAFQPRKSRVQRLKTRRTRSL
ncbi:MAG: hypothetical protein M2R45_01872 [Verrucomicrobia subdivision 3 bacterium]|nr:hypothetical protein [Limisphaerales bacterium]MCS1415672.1 hypothetical protein [Limisphaerales bacterium]